MAYGINELQRMTIKELTKIAQELAVPAVAGLKKGDLVEAILEAGIVEQQAERKYFYLKETARYINEEMGVDIVALPTDDYRLTVWLITTIRHSAVSTQAFSTSKKNLYPNLLPPVLFAF